MRVTRYTDYGLRVLMYLALQGQRRSTIREISEAFGISRNHLMKVVQQLAALGYVNAVRGVGGGLLLARPPGQVRLGEVLVDMEPDLGLVECMRPEGTCVISPVCRLSGALDEALKSFVDTLNRHTLADLVEPAVADRLRLLLKVDSG
ncbi:MAG: Rrf2 family transcriptional regulator [Wenzhouxiangella sp.]|nr:MAG: Rrf2 family transcriptional regulator [Wenzhouxiangella sp.]